MNVIKILKSVKGWVSRLMELEKHRKHKKAENSCCLLVNNDPNKNCTAQGIFCRLINEGVNIGPRFGLLTCHHVIPSKAETLGWTVYYGEEYFFELEPSIIDNFYSCCTIGEHFDKKCPFGLDFTLIEFVDEAPIRRDIELLDLDYTQNLNSNSIVKEGQCYIYQRQQNKIELCCEDHDYTFNWMQGELRDWSNFSILTPKQIKGKGTSGCPVVSFPTDDESPHLLGMHTCTATGYKDESLSVNTSIVQIIKLLKFQKDIVNKEYDELFDLFWERYGEASKNFDTKQMTWMIVNRLHKLKKNANFLDIITEICKCMSNLLSGLYHYHFTSSH